MSNKVRFLPSETPFHCGVPGGVSCETIPHSFRSSSKFWLKYSPPWSYRSVLILLPCWFCTSFLNFLNLSRASYLCHIRYTYPNLLKSSVNVMKYWNPPLACVFIGPHTSLCIKPNKSLALSPFQLKGDLVIFPNKHESHTTICSKTEGSNNPSL